MYRTYLSSTETATASESGEGAKLWNTLDKDVRHGRKNPAYEANTSTRNVRTVRVFVSSTFRDFFSERDILIKKVFPAIREWLQNYNMNIVECDLRWGVPIESTTQHTITSCLEELDRYRKETGDQPFFLGLLGDRAGWIPTSKDVGDDLWQRYEWLPGVSITGMEILRGAYWNNNPNACFLIRDRSFLQNVPEEFHSDFLEKPGDYADSVIQETKRRVLKKFGSRAVTYSCRFRELDEQNTLGVKKVILDGLEQFCEHATDFLKSFIKRFYDLPDEAPKQLPSDGSSIDETAVQQGYLESLLTYESHGRREEVEKIVSWIDRRGSVDLPRLTYNEEPSSNQNDQLLCVRGELGVGKTYLSALLLRSLRQKPDVRVIYQFCEARSESALVEVICQSVYQQASVLLGDSAPSSDGPAKNELQGAFDQLASADFQTVIVIDGLNYTHRVDQWMPKTPFPPNVWVVATTVNGDRHGHSVMADLGALELQLHALPRQDCEQWIVSYFGEFNKRLDATQMDALLGNGGVGNPTWLQLALEELHVYGEYSTVLKRIQTLPPDLTKLSGEILTRVLHDDETGKLESLLCYLTVAREGLYEADLPFLLGDFLQEPKTVMPPVVVAQLKREIRGFTRFTTIGQLRISTNFLRSLLRARLIREFQNGCHWHDKLASFYDASAHDSYVITRELPFHLLKANARERLVAFFRADKRCRANHVERKQYLQDLLCPMNVSAQKVPAFLCQFCANSIGKLSPYQPSASTCYLCGLNVAFKPAQACFCHIHGFSYQMGNMTKCAVCSNVVLPQMAKPMNICSFCQYSVVPPDRCCKFLKEGEQMYQQLWNQTSYKWLDEYNQPSDSN